MHILHESPDSLRRQICMLYATVNIALYKHMGHVGGQDWRAKERSGKTRLQGSEQTCTPYQQYYPDLMNDRVCVCVCARACVCVCVCVCVCMCVCKLVQRMWPHVTSHSWYVPLRTKPQYVDSRDICPLQPEARQCKPHEELLVIPKTAQVYNSSIQHAQCTHSCSQQHTLQN